MAATGPSLPLSSSAPPRRPGLPVRAQRIAQRSGGASPGRGEEGGHRLPFLLLLLRRGLQTPAPPSRPPGEPGASAFPSAPLSHSTRIVRLSPDPARPTFAASPNPALLPLPSGPDRPAGLLADLPGPGPASPGSPFGSAVPPVLPPLRRRVRPSVPSPGAPCGRLCRSGLSQAPRSGPRTREALGKYLGSTRGESIVLGLAETRHPRRIPSSDAVPGREERRVEPGLGVGRSRVTPGESLPFSGPQRSLVRKTGMEAASPTRAGDRARPHPPVSTPAGPYGARRAVSAQRIP
ncbi:cuticle collagen 2-like [Ornithorhynchus anatinus]|uniref:cuticle collagen 2-like n=1 Tax=Ornithorhynchus anatinus TaxID=9258 RepID=UPI0019D4D9A6|nr:cuticle collagen 2-like [Ornithorhynchus anatinus]